MMLDGMGIAPGPAGDDQRVDLHGDAVAAILPETIKGQHNGNPQLNWVGSQSAMPGQIIISTMAKI